MAEACSVLVFYISKKFEQVTPKFETRKKTHKMIITNSNDFDNYTPPYWLVYLIIR